MGVMMVMALAIPEAFRDRAASRAPSARWSSPWATSRCGPSTHQRLFALAGRGFDPGLLGTPWCASACRPRSAVGLIIAAVFTTAPGQLGLWVAGLAVDLIGVGAGHRPGGLAAQLAEPTSAERHSLIIIIALGESIVAIGAAWPACR